MNRQEIEKKVNDILVDVLGISYSEIKDEAKFVDDFGADSLDCVELILEIELKFRISIEDEDAGKCETVKDVYDLVEKLL